MPQFKITSPDGKTYIVNAPEGSTREEALARVQAHAKKAPQPGLRDKIAGVAGNFLEGMLPGSSGFVRGAGEVVKNAVQAPFSDKVDFTPGKAYSEGQRFQNNRNKIAQRTLPGTTEAAQWAGIANGLVMPAAKIARGANLLQKARAGAKTAGTYGALSGAMSSQKDSFTGKATDAISSGILSAGVGGALPVAAKAAGVMASPLRPLYDSAARRFGMGLEGLSDVLPASMARAVRHEGQQLARDPIRARANEVLDTDLRAGTNPATGEAFTPPEVVEEVRRRQAMGVPAAPADIHESARRSFGAAARAPGPATAAVRRAIDRRQEQSTQRVAGHIADTLGPTANVEQQADALKDFAKQVSRPLYDISDQQPIPNVKELQELMARPSARDALQIAGRQLRDEGEDVSAYGLRELPGDVFEVASVPTMAMYDRLKTVMDDTVYQGGKALAAPEVTRASRGAATIRSRLLQLMDGDGSGPPVPRGPGQDIVPQAPGGVPQAPQVPPQMPQLPPGLPKAPPSPRTALPAPEAFPADVQPGNPFPVPYEAPSRPGRVLEPEVQAPDMGPPSPAIPPEGLNPFWKPARDAYAGPIQAKKALELGEEMAGDGADDIVNRFGDLTGTQRDFFQLGHRSALAKDVKKLGDWGNAAARVGGSASKREGLQAAHGSRADDLLDRTAAEHEAHQTWKAVRGNSQTADRLAEMDAQDQQIEAATKGFMQVLSGRPGEGIANAFKALGNGERHAAEVKGKIAEVLSETDMSRLEEAVREMERERLRKLTTGQRRAVGTQRASRFLGDLLGTNMIEQTED